MKPRLVVCISRSRSDIAYISPRHRINQRNTRRRSKNHTNMANIIDRDARYTTSLTGEGGAIIPRVMRLSAAS